MKYANLKFSARSINNLGDNIQIIALDYIYERMGINKEDIVYIDYHELSTYNGEYVILPVAFPMIDYIENGIAGRFSEHIIPVFISFVLQRDFLYPAEIEYLKKYEPIGCRDKITNSILKRYNIKSYIHGCITFLFPERSDSKTYNTIFVVDAEDKLLKKLPEHFLDNKNIEYRTQIINTETPKEKALCQYDEYKNNACLVITSLLHCALPCFAAGIPIIMLNEKVACRKAFLEVLFPIYNSNTINKATPSVLSKQLKIQKAKILDFTLNRIITAYKNNVLLYDTSFFYEKTEKNDSYINEMFTPFKNYIDEKWTDYNKNYNYSVFGLNNTSEMLVNYISTKYINAKLISAYDNYKNCSFFNKKTQSIDKIEYNNENYLFVTAYGAIESIKKYEQIIVNRDIEFVKIDKETVSVSKKQVSTQIYFMTIRNPV